MINTPFVFCTCSLYRNEATFLDFVSLLVSKPLVQCGILSMINTPFVYPTRPLYRNEATFIDFSLLRSGSIGVCFIDSIPHCPIDIVLSHSDSVGYYR